MVKRVIGILLTLLIFPLLIVLGQDVQIYPAGTIHSPEKQSRLPGGETFSLTSKDGTRLEAFHLPAAEAPRNRFKVAIILHGNGVNLDYVAPYHRWFSRLGISSYSLDYRGFGNSEGWPSENGIYQDSEALWNEALAREKIKPSEVIVFSHSLGGGPAAHLAGNFSPGAVILLSPFSSLDDVVKERPGVSLLSPFLWSHFPVADMLQSYKDGCIMIAHGTADRVISVSHSERIKTRYNGNASTSIYLPEGIGHNEIFIPAKPFLEKKIAECETAVASKAS